MLKKDTRKFPTYKAAQQSIVVVSRRSILADEELPIQHEHIQDIRRDLDRTSCSEYGNCLIDEVTERQAIYICGNTTRSK